jgi:hypothetical protein
MRRSAFITATAIALASSASADERAASVPWPMLAKVSLLKQGDRYVPAFPKELAALDNTQVKLQGFVLMRDDAGGLLYRVTDAVAVSK